MRTYKKNIKRKANLTQETAQQILAAELTAVTPAAAVQLPHIQHLRRNIRYQRRDDQILPNPLRKEDIPPLPQQYQVTPTGERFLLHDGGLGNNR